MLTYSGVNMLPEGSFDAPSPEDLAVQMGRICQFGGAVWWTLLAHSVFVGEIALELLKQKMLSEGPKDRGGEWTRGCAWTWAWALMHDAHEVVTSDVPRGWKPEALKKLQLDLDDRIRARYGFVGQPVDFERVKRADVRATYVQAWMLDLGRGEYRRRHGANTPEERERALFERILMSGLNVPDILDKGRLHSMVNVFSLIEEGAPVEAEELVRTQFLEDARA